MSNRNTVASLIDTTRWRLVARAGELVRENPLRDECISAFATTPGACVPPR